MKRILLYILFLTGSFSFATAQPPGDTIKNQERVEALYVAYVTQKLNLTEAEAQKFWPVHKQFQNEIKAVNPELPELDRQQSILNIKKKYQDKFVTILGSERTNTFYKLHGEFIIKLAEIRKKRQQQAGRRKMN